MKKILSFILLVCLSLGAMAQTKPQAMKSLMQKERLSNIMQTPDHQQAKLASAVSADWSAYSVAKAPAQLAGLDTTEVYFTSFYSFYYTPLDTIVDRRGNTVITGGDWYFVLRNQQYQFIFDLYGGTPESPAGTYTEEDLDDDLYSWCIFPEADGKTHYYKTCDLTVTEERVSESVVKYTLDAVVLATLGKEGEEYGYFKVHGEHKMVVAKEKYDVAILNCEIAAEEDRIRIAGQDDTIAVDLTFFTELGIEGYYSHKIMDAENSKIVHRGVTHEISELEGIIASAETKTGGMAYVFMFEAMTTDAYFYNVAMEVPIVPTDTVKISCYNMKIDDSFGMSDATITVTASDGQYSILAGYNASKVTAPATYDSEKSLIYVTNLATGKEIVSMQSTLKITGNALKGYQVNVRMLGDDHKYYVIDMEYAVPEVKETVNLDFANSAKAIYYIDNLGLKEVQFANYNGEYSVSIDILKIDQVMDDEFSKANLWMDQTFLTHHSVKDGIPEDIAVEIYDITGKLWQENDTTYLTASLIGFDSIQYEVSMFYAVPTPTETVTYTFDGLGNDDVEFINALSSGLFILDGMSSDGELMAKVNVERITTNTLEGTFYNDGKFDHNDFYDPDTYVSVLDAKSKKYIEYAVQKGTITVSVMDNILTAVASFICDNAVQYDLTFKVEYARERIPFDTEDGEFDYTFPSDAEVIVNDYIKGYRIVQLIIADNDFAADFYFYAEALDSEIGVPAGTYPINKSYKTGTVLACKGVLPDGPAQSYICSLDADGYLTEEQLYCLVDGVVTVQNVDGKLSLEVDAINSYEVPVKVRYNETPTGLENVNIANIKSSKRIVNGQLLIIRNGELYDATGAKL